MRAVLLLLSVFGVLTGCVSGVDSSPDSAAEMRAAVGRSAHVLRETHAVGRDLDAVTATIAARAQGCLPGAELAEAEDGRLTLVAASKATGGTALVVDLTRTEEGTRIVVVRDNRSGLAEASAILDWAGGRTRPCPSPNGG